MLVLIRQARIINAGSRFHDKVVDLLIENGVIKTIAPTIDTKAETIIEAEGLCVSAGWVDVFADYCEPGYEHKETIKTGLKAAAAGGFTDVLLAPNTNPIVANKAAVQYILKQAQGNVVNLHPLGAATQNTDGKTLAEMMDMKANGAIAFTDGWKPIQNANLMLKVLEYVNAFEGTVIQLPIDMSLAEGGLMNEGVVSTRLGVAGIPGLAETLMVHRDIELVRYTRSRIHITGISLAESVALIRQAKKEGLPVTCSVTPYHLVLTEEALTGYSSMYKVAPPLRSEADRQALIAGLKDGTIDCIATHHRPQEWDAKAKEFEYAAEGMNVQELAFNIIWDALSKDIATDKLVYLLADRAREIFALPKIEIAEGNKTEITIFTTNGDMTLTGDQVQSASRNNPFTGKKLSGKVLGIINHSKIHINK